MSRLRVLARSAVIISLSAATAVVSFAQTNTAKLLGIVSDASGAVVVGAKKAMSRESNMHADEESDGCVVCAEQRIVLEV